MNVKSLRNYQRTFIFWTFFSLCVVTSLSGIKAEKEVCPHEKMQLSCPNLELEIKNGNYEELYWTVTDPNTKVKKNLAHCTEDLICANYTEGVFKTRIKIGNSFQGKLNVTLTKKKDLLTFACEIHRKQNKPTLADPRNVSSSVNCLALEAGQDVNLNEALGEFPSPETIEDTDRDWYWIKHNEKKQKIVYCHTSCQFKGCNESSFPQFWKRLKINGTKLMLTNVSEEDRGSKLECRMYPKTVGKTVVNTLKIKQVFPSESFSSASHGINSKTPLQTPSQTPLQTFSQMPLQPPSNTLSRSSTAWVHGTESSAGSRVLAFAAVFVSLFIAFF